MLPAGKPEGSLCGSCSLPTLVIKTDLIQVGHVISYLGKLSSVLHVSVVRGSDDKVMNYSNK